MFQKKGHNPEKSFPFCKMIIPNSPLLQEMIIKKCLELGFKLNVPEKLNNGWPHFMYFRDGLVGHNCDYEAFKNTGMKEISFSDMMDYKQIPVKMTMEQICAEIGHKIIIEEGETKK